MFKTILVPTDGSEFAGRAEDAAISMAGKYGAKIVGVYLIDESFEESFDVLEDEGKLILENLKKKAKKADVIMDELIILGDPCKDLITITRKTEADIVVLGTHGKKGLEKLMVLGSVAESILKYVEVPILLVK